METNAAEATRNTRRSELGACCRVVAWLLVASFVLGWTPVVLVLTGRWRFRYGASPACEIVLPPAAVRWAPAGPPGALPPGLDDFLGVTAKRLAPHAAGLDSAEACHGATVAQAEALADGRCAVRVARADGAKPDALVVLPAEPEAGVGSKEECVDVVGSALTHARWVLEDVCETVTADGRRRGTVEHNATACAVRGGRWLRQDPPLRLPPALAGAGYAFAHAGLGGAFFVLGLLNIDYTGFARGWRATHRAVGYAYAALNVATWVVTWPVIITTSADSTLRLCTNAFGQVYWVVTLVRGIRSTRRGDYEGHRRWMLRNYATAFAIVLGRYVGTPVLVAGLGLWRGIKEYESMNILFGWLFTHSALEVYLERTASRAAADLAPPAKPKAA